MLLADQKAPRPVTSDNPCFRHLAKLYVYNLAQSGARTTKTSAHWQQINRCTQRSFDRVRGRSDSSGCILATPAPFPLDSPVGHIIVLTGHVGRKCRSLRVAALAMYRTSQGFSRKGTRSYRGLGAGSFAESYSGGGVSIDFYCDSTC
jgi:hypothetical protein